MREWADRAGFTSPNGSANAPPAALLIKAGDGFSMMTELSHPGARAGEDKNNGRG